MSDPVEVEELIAAPTTTTETDEELREAFEAVEKETEVSDAITKKNQGRRRRRSDIFLQFSRQNCLTLLSVFLLMYILSLCRRKSPLR